jgi:outer membrane protein OmpA-like peptidoglycan-associated protein
LNRLAPAADTRDVNATQPLLQRNARSQTMLTTQPPLHAASFVLRGLLLAAMAGATVAAEAGSVRYYGEGQVPHPSVVASVLSGQRAAAPRLKTRGGTRSVDEPAAQLPDDGGRTLHEDPQQRELALSTHAQAAVTAWREQVGDKAPAAAAAEQDAPRTLALAVRFANASAALQPSATQSLDAVAEGLQQVGFARRFVIEGHTSATGSAAFNQRLSLQRALSVKRYLVEHHGIPSQALRVVGRGFAAPLNPSNPQASENRRVQFRAAA